MTALHSDRALLSAQAEDYLKALYSLGQPGPVSTQSLADTLKVSPASVSGMLRKLAEQGLVNHKPYLGAALTERGEKVALEVLRHHRLLELYLTRALGYGWDEVHAEADKLEHVISEALEARIARALGDPHYDPHGHPIPRPDGSLPELGGVQLPDSAPNRALTLLRVQGEDADFLRYLTEQGLQPGATLQVVDIDTHGGTLTLKVGDATRVLGVEAARRLWVVPLGEAPHGR